MLEAARKQWLETESAAARATLAEQSTKAPEKADLSVAAAQAARIRAKAEAEAAAAVAKGKAEAEAKKAEAEGDIAMFRANQVKANTETKVAAETVIDEARKLELRRRAEDRAIQAKPRRFTTPAYWQADKMARELKPHRFSKLKSHGALEAATEGSRESVKIVTDKDDKVRPRWKTRALYFMNHPAQIERVEEARDLPNELGPTLVETKLLEP